jgi:hypothetical protein
VSDYGADVSGAEGDEEEPYLSVNGTIHDNERGRVIGSFTRSLYLDSGVVEHKTFFISKDYQGGGVGGLYTVTSDALYRHLGMKFVQLTAVSEPHDAVTGHQMWALQGYDWINTEAGENARKAFLSGIGKEYGKESQEYAQVKTMVAGEAPATDFARYTDTNGKKIGFELMHLDKLQKNSREPLPSLMPMGRSLTGGRTDLAWRTYKDKTIDGLKQIAKKKHAAPAETRAQEAERGARRRREHLIDRGYDAALDDAHDLIDAINAAYADV